MRILFLTDNFPPEVNALATRTFEHCKEWVKMGVEVTVVTCFPNFPQGVIYAGYKNALYATEMIEGIKVVRVWSYVAPNKGVYKRIVDYSSFAFSAFVAGLILRSEVVIASSPQFMPTISACLLSFFKRIPWVFELRDLYPESIEAVEAIKNRFVIKVLEKLELFLYKNAELVVAVTEAFKKNLIERGIPDNKIKIVTNGSNLELLKPRPKNEGLLNKYGLRNKFLIGYIGTHGMAHGLDSVLESISKIRDPDVYYIFVGDGARKQELIELATRKEIKNVLFLDPVSKDMIPEYISILDAALVNLRKAETFRKVIPSKIFEAAAMQKPILCGVDGQARELVEQYNAGIFYEPENEDDFIGKSLLLKNDVALYERLQQGCQLLARDYDRKKLAKEMYMYVKEVVDEN